jgi:hypothetical protein
VRPASTQRCNVFELGDGSIQYSVDLMSFFWVTAEYSFLFRQRQAMIRRKLGLDRERAEEGHPQGAEAKPTQPAPCPAVATTAA